MNLVEIGKALSERRTFFKLRQEDLAELSQVTVKTIQLIELGKGNPSFKTLSKLTRVLGMDIKVHVKIIK